MCKRKMIFHKHMCKRKMIFHKHCSVSVRTTQATPTKILCILLFIFDYALQILTEKIP